MNDPNPCPTCGAPLPSDATAGACPKCLLQAGFATGGAAPADRVPTPEDLAPKFPGLVIEELLGRGGMGVVYKARHKALDREVALKVLPERVAQDKAFADRFQREARALAKLQHPNIVAVHDFGHAVDETGDGLYWLVMEYVDGANIRQAMRAGAIGPKEALAIVPQICDALQYAHEHGVVHRDIKPENVLLDKAGRVKVADFGLAKLMERDAADLTLTGAGQVMGTPHYMAPEQWEKPTTVDHRADIYSLGVVFYEMLTGELPVGRFAAPSGKCDVDARIDEIVLRTLEREREARYQRVVDVKTDMGQAAGRASVAPAPATPAIDVQPARRGRLSKLAVFGACLVPAATGAAIFTAYVTHHDGPAAAVGGSGFLATMIVGVVAWVRIERSGDKLRGRVWAAVGTFLPVVAGCVIGPFLVLLPIGDERRQREAAFENEEFRKAEAANAAREALAKTSAEPSVEIRVAPHAKPFDRADLTLFAATDWKRLCAKHGTLTIEGVREFYSPVDFLMLKLTSDNDLKRKAGLPLADVKTLGAPLAGFHIEWIDVHESGTDATVTARIGQGHRIQFPIVYFEGRWYFAIGPVELL